MKQQFNQIIIDFINHDEQRYNTSGDYFIKNNILYIKISKEYNENKRKKIWEWLVLIHELVEVLLVIARDISIDEIDRFDMDFEKMKKESEPGNDKNAPYHNEHTIATKIEMILAKEFKVNWDEYNDY
jgi:hypothetical protein